MFFRIKDMYTNGKYYEYHHPVSQSKAAILIKNLLWAAQSKIPFNQALLTLTDDGQIPDKDDICLINIIHWNINLKQAYIDLSEGKTLGQTLRKRFSYLLPEFSLSFIEESEQKDNLIPALTSLSKRIDVISDIKIKLSSTLVYPLSMFAIIVMLSGIISSFICPRLSRLVIEHTGSTDTVPTALKILNYIKFSLTINSNTIFTLITLIFILVILRYFKSYTKKCAAFIFYHIICITPFLKNYYTSLILLEITSGMASFIDAGSSILDASELCYQSCNHYQLKRKMRCFNQQVKNGISWDQAWLNMKIKHPLNKWIICNSAAMENPVKGFDTLSSVLENEVMHISKKICIIIYLLFITINSIIVSLFVFGVFSSITVIFDYLSTQV